MIASRYFIGGLPSSLTAAPIAAFTLTTNGTRSKSTALGIFLRVAELEVIAADVTKLEVDAIANAANTHLRHGGGVAAAISRAGGPAVQRESDERAPIGLGDAVETTAGDMPARLVIH